MMSSNEDLSEVMEGVFPEDQEKVAYRKRMEQVAMTPVGKMCKTDEAEQKLTIIPEDWQLPGTCPDCGSEVAGVYPGEVNDKVYITHDKVIYKCLTKWTRDWVMGKAGDHRRVISKKEWQFERQSTLGDCLERRLAAMSDRVAVAESDNAVKDELLTVLYEKYRDAIAFDCKNGIYYCPYCNGSDRNHVAIEHDDDCLITEFEKALSAHPGASILDRLAVAEETARVLAETLHKQDNLVIGIRTENGIEPPKEQTVDLWLEWAQTQAKANLESKKEGGS